MKMGVLNDSWRRFFGDGFDESMAFLNFEYGSKCIYPPMAKVFRAFDLCDFEKVKVVILGQDPYHGEGQADGLCFSVPEGVKVPPSLRNIYKEVEADLGVKVRGSGDLGVWAKQGVLLLNAILTVEEGKARSHAGKGWEEFTDRVVKCLSEEREGLVFMLWGKDACRKGAVIDRFRHLVLEAAHPSPLSAYKGFFGCKHFSKANAYLRKKGKKVIDWN